MATARTLVAIAALPFAVEAIHMWEPRATGAIYFRDDGFTPKPTDMPRIHDLVRRDSPPGQTVLAAPDNTCGYIDGLPGAGYTCPPTDLCVLFTAHSTSTGSVACCNTEACYWRRACVDSVGFYTSSQCTGGCEFDQYTLKWYGATAD